MTSLRQHACEKNQQNTGNTRNRVFVPADGGDANQDGALPGQTFDLPGLQLSTGVHEHVASVHERLYVNIHIHRFIYKYIEYHMHICVHTIATIICTHARDRTALIILEYLGYSRPLLC